MSTLLLAALVAGGTCYALYRVLGRKSVDQVNQSPCVQPTVPWDRAAPYQPLQQPVQRQWGQPQPQPYQQNQQPQPVYQQQPSPVGSFVAGAVAGAVVDELLQNRSRRDYEDNYENERNRRRQREDDATPVSVWGSDTVSRQTVSDNVVTSSGQQTDNSFDRQWDANATGDNADNSPQQTQSYESPAQSSSNDSFWSDSGSSCSSSDCGDGGGD